MLKGCHHISIILLATKIIVDEFANANNDYRGDIANLKS